MGRIRLYSDLAFTSSFFKEDNKVVKKWDTAIGLADEFHLRTMRCQM